MNGHPSPPLLTDVDVVLAVVALCSGGELPLGAMDEVELLALLRGSNRRTAAAWERPLLLLSTLRETRPAATGEAIRWDNVIAELTGWPRHRALLAIVGARLAGLVDVEPAEMPS